MKIDVNTKFKNLDGSVIPEGPPQGEKKSPPFTLKTACVNVLLGTRTSQITCPKCRNVIEKPEELSPEEKAKRYMFATKIYNSIGLMDLQAEEIALLKKLIGKQHIAIISGQAWQILDPHSAEKKK